MNSAALTSHHSTERFIQRLYCEAATIAPEDFRSWALLQLTELLNVDAALWGTGNLSSLRFHYLEHCGLDGHYSERLIETLSYNPMRPTILRNMDFPIAMSDVIDDDAFFKSRLYGELFEPYGIQRILATGHIEKSSKLHTLISLYRFDRNADFLAYEKEIISRLIFHLVSAASHNFFLHLRSECEDTAMAICDKHGCYWQAQSRFFDLLAKTPLPYEGVFPLSNDTHQCLQQEGLNISVEKLGELFQISLRKHHPRDQLSDRERQIVSWIIKGLTFKEVAKELGIAPSTISNHLYRIYQKLEVTSRSELAKLMTP